MSTLRNVGMPMITPAIDNNIHEYLTLLNEASLAYRDAGWEL